MAHTQLSASEAASPRSRSAPIFRIQACAGARGVRGGVELGGCCSGCGRGVRLSKKLTCGEVVVGQFEKQWGSRIPKPAILHGRFSAWFSAWQRCLIGFVWPDGRVIRARPSTSAFPWESGGRGMEGAESKSLPCWPWALATALVVCVRCVHAGLYLLVGPDEEILDCTRSALVVVLHYQESIFPTPKARSILLHLRIQPPPTAPEARAVLTAILATLKVQHCQRNTHEPRCV